MIKRSLESILARRHFDSPDPKMAFISGPRQVGKTTLARRLLEARGTPDLYFNWDDLAFRRSVARDPYGFADRPIPLPAQSKPLLALDEIHKFPRWKSYLKGLWDTRRASLDVLVTGSGRLDLFQKGGDSLLGRYRAYRLHPLSVREITAPDIDPDPDASSPDAVLAAVLARRDTPDSAARDAFSALFRWGGFPDVFLRRDPAALRLWHGERKRLIVREDLRDLTRIQLVSHVEELMELLPERAGGVLSCNALHEDLQVAVDSVRLWTDALARLYYLYTLRPYAKRIVRAIRREPKLYLWDWSEIEDEGHRFENLVAGHLLKWRDFNNDLGLEPLGLHYVRDKEKREVDFLLTRGRQATPWLLIETRLGASPSDTALHHFAAQLGVKHKLIVCAEPVRPALAGDVRIIDAASFLSALPV